MQNNIVRQKAFELIKSLGLHLPGNSLCVSLDWVFQDFRVLLTPELSTLARSHWIPLSEKSGYWLIEMLASSSKSTRRHALAHELGHIYLEHKPLNHILQQPIRQHSFDGQWPVLEGVEREFKIVTRLQTSQMQLQEFEANLFAAYLLIPQRAIKQAVAYGWTRAELAERLRVPLELLDLRFDTL